MSKSAQFFLGFAEQIAGMVRVAVLARVERFDGSRADIQPLHGDLPLISQAYVCGGPYESGDVVLAVFLDSPLGEETTERHRLEDAVVVGKVTL